MKRLFIGFGLFFLSHAPFAQAVEELGVGYSVVLPNSEHFTAAQLLATVAKIQRATDAFDVVIPHRTGRMCSAWDWAAEYQTPDRNLRLTGTLQCADDRVASTPGARLAFHEEVRDFVIYGLSRSLGLTFVPGRSVDGMGYPSSIAQDSVGFSFALPDSKDLTAAQLIDALRSIENAASTLTVAAPDHSPVRFCKAINFSGSQGSDGNITFSAAFKCFDRRVVPTPASREAFYADLEGLLLNEMSTATGFSFQPTSIGGGSVTGSNG